MLFPSIDWNPLTIWMAAVITALAIVVLLSVGYLIRKAIWGTRNAAMPQIPQELSMAELEAMIQRMVQKEIARQGDPNVTRVSQFIPGETTLRSMLAIVERILAALIILVLIGLLIVLSFPVPPR